MTAVTRTTPAAGLGRTERLRVNDQEVRYFDSEHEPSTLPPIVLVHGTGGSTHRHFPFLFPMLATDRRVLAVDLSTPDCRPEEGPHRFAEQVLAMVEEASPGRAVALAGYSLGAVVAATAAAMRPDLVASLVLMAGWFRTDAQQRLRNEIWQGLRSNPELLGKYQALCAYSAPYLALRTREERVSLIANVADDDATAAQMEMNRVVDLSTVAPSIACPTLVVAGTDDQMTPRRQAKRLFGAITGARYTEVTSGHAMVAERPPELVHLVNSFTSDPLRHPAGSQLPARRP